MQPEVVVLEHAPSGASADILVSQGFNCFSWRAPLKSGVRELLFAPEGFGEGDKRPSSGGIPLLFPFPGRIACGSFEFQGKTYAVPPGDGLGNALHGFVFDRPWRLVDCSETHVTAEFQGAIDAPDTLDQWPNDYRIRATYRLEAERLICEVRYDNPGQGPLPCAFGTHAYFRLPLGGKGKVEETVLTAPVDAQWVFRDMIPTGTLEQNESTESLPRGLRLGDQAFDDGYRLSKGKTGPIETTVSAGGVTLAQSCDASFGCYVIYTPGSREAVCIEPYTCVPNPFELEAEGVKSGLEVLAPGDAKEHTIVLEVRE
jgi:aldose 1-epimerase